MPPDLLLHAGNRRRRDFGITAAVVAAIAISATAATVAGIAVAQAASNAVVVNT